MKKGIFSILSSVFFCSLVQAQIYSPELKIENTNNGYIGIGKAIPEYFFDINGNMCVGDTEGKVYFRRLDGNASGLIGFSGSDLFLQNNSGSGVLQFKTNVNGAGLSEVMRIDGSFGNVGIGGVTEPQERLHVNGNIYLETNSLMFRGLYSRMNEIYSVGGSSGTEGSWYFTSFYDNLIFNSGASTSGPRKTVFRIGTVERMRINSNGNVGIGVSSPSQKLHVNGNVLASNVSVTSDRKLKKDIRNYEEGLAMITQMNPVKFKYKPRKVKRAEYDSLNHKESIVNEFDVDSNDDKDYIGIIAQEIKEIAPDLVDQFINDEGEEVLTVNHTALTFLLINAVKEQQLMIKNLQSQIAKFGKSE